MRALCALLVLGGLLISCTSARDSSSATSDSSPAGHSAIAPSIAADGAPGLAGPAPSTHSVAPGTTTSAPNPSVGDGETIFFDDFDDLDSSHWTVMDREGDWDNEEEQCYRPAHVTVSEGGVTLSADAASHECDGVHRSTNPQSPGYPPGYASGMIAWPSQRFTYGRVEVRVRVSPALGAWPAVWLMGTDCQRAMVFWLEIGACHWPDPGSDEIDLVEFLNSDWFHVNQQIHSGDHHDACKPTVSAGDGSWHVYAMDWSPEKLTFFVDGDPSCVVTTGVPSGPMFVIANLAVGGKGAARVDSATFPASVTLDYVRVVANLYTR